MRFVFVVMIFSEKLPVEVIWDNTKKIEYLYSATGEKLRKKVTDGSQIATTEYLDGFQYKQELLEFFPHAEGYVNATPSSLNPSNPQYTFNYVYNHTDHLGNIRISYTKDPQTGKLKILDESHYYPFGLKHQEYQISGFVKDTHGVIVAPLAHNPYQYKYNGKELQDELNLNWYDYGWRNYDPAIGRWMNIDPLAEQSRRFSPYTYALNNPVYFIDPDGMKVDPNSKKQWYGHKNDIATKKDDLQNEADGLKVTAKEKGWSERKLNRKMGNLNERISSLDSSLAKMTELEKSEDTYSLKQTGKGEHGYTSYNSETKAIDLAFDGSTSQFVHELDHGYQIESGSAVAYLNGLGAWSLSHEVEAYKSQFAYDPDYSLFKETGRSVFEGRFKSEYITTDWVRNISNGIYSNHSVNTINIHTSREDLLKMFPGSTLPNNYKIINDPKVFVPKRFLK